MFASLKRRMRKSESSPALSSTASQKISSDPIPASTSTSKSTSPLLSPPSPSVKAPQPPSSTNPAPSSPKDRRRSTIPKNRDRRTFSLGDITAVSEDRNTKSKNRATNVDNWRASVSGGFDLNAAIARYGGESDRERRGSDGAESKRSPTMTTTDRQRKRGSMMLPPRPTSSYFGGPSSPLTTTGSISGESTMTKKTKEIALRDVRPAQSRPDRYETTRASLTDPVPIRSTQGRTAAADAGAFYQKSVSEIRREEKSARMRAALALRAGAASDSVEVAAEKHRHFQKNIVTEMKEEDGRRRRATIDAMVRASLPTEAAAESKDYRIVEDYGYHNGSAGGRMPSNPLIVPGASYVPEAPSGAADEDRSRRRGGDRSERRRTYYGSAPTIY